MIWKILRQPAGFVGAVLLAFGLWAGVHYDPSEYEPRNTSWIVDSGERVKAELENSRKEQDRDTEVIIILSCIGFGILMLGSATWKARHPDREQEAEPQEPETHHTDPS